MDKCPKADYTPEPEQDSSSYPAKVFLSTSQSPMDQLCHKIWVGETVRSPLEPHHPHPAAGEAGRDGVMFPEVLCATNLLIHVFH